MTPMIVIGEKINGAVPAVAQAIADRNEGFIQNLAQAQAQAGADYLDVCATVRRGEEEALGWVIDQVQAVTDLPLCVDSPDPGVLLAMMERCARPGILNSVSLERDKADRILPAIAGTGWSCICLLCEKAIPAATQERLAVLDRLLEKAERYGVRPEQLFIDPMVQMLCTSENGVLTVLEVIRAVKTRFPALHVAGAVSNVSFNLPVRRILNQTFLPLAMAAGMDAAVLDPCARDLMGTLYGASAMLGEDLYCTDYLDAFRRDLFGPANKRRKL